MGRKIRKYNSIKVVTGKGVWKVASLDAFDMGLSHTLGGVIEHMQGMETSRKAVIDEDQSR